MQSDEEVGVPVLSTNHNRSVPKSLIQMPSHRSNKTDKDTCVPLSNTYKLCLRALKTRLPCTVRAGDVRKLSGLRTNVSWCCHYTLLHYELAIMICSMQL